MTTKYTHESSVEKAIEAHRAPYSRSPAHPYTPFRRRPYKPMMLFMLVLMAALMIFSRSRSNPFAGQPWIRGQATLNEKMLVQEEGHTGYNFTLTLDTGLTGNFTASEEHWNALQKGDHVGVLFRLSRDGKQLHIRECSLVALPEKSR